jgi:uncharacterized protein
MQSVDAFSGPRLEPIAPSERILTIDVLRGIALFGVLTANIWLWFSGAIYLFPGLVSELRQASLDSIAFYFVGIFISGKAITTFSFLFGLGFAVQMTRAESRGARIAPVYRRRLAVLLAIGALHGVLLWYGDILATYALLGFGLLLFHRRAERTLLVWAAILIVVVPLTMATIPLGMSVAGLEAGPPPAQELVEMTERNQMMLARFASRDPAQIVAGNLLELRRLYLSPKAVSFVMLFGVFLLGLYAGRRRIFENLAAHRRQLRALAAWGLAIGLTSTLAGAALRMAIDLEVAMGLPWFPLAMTASFVFGSTPFACAYVVAAALLLESPRWRARLSAFAPVGRMALTNYLAQTVICLAIYYGGGLFGSFHGALNVLIAVVIFAVQMQWSAWWLAHYRFGPMEWVWRSLTYGHMQPMRIAAAQPAAAVRAG